MFFRALLSLAALILLLAPQSTSAQNISAQVDTEIISMNLSGQSEVGLGSDPGNTLPGSQDGFHPVLSAVSVTESSRFASTGSLTITMATDLSVPENPVVGGVIDSQFDFFLDLGFEDIDSGFDYGPGLGNSFSLFSSAAPLSVQLSTEFEFSVLDLLDGAEPTFSDLGDVISSTTAVYELGVDINQNGENDLIKLTASDLEFDLDELLFSDFVIGDEDLLNFLGGSLQEDIEVAFRGDLQITSTTLTFAGQVLDPSTDPPFDLVASGATSTISAVPEPSSATCAFLLLLAIVCTLRRREQGLAFATIRK